VVEKVVAKHESHPQEHRHAIFSGAPRRAIGICLGGFSSILMLDKDKSIVSNLKRFQVANNNGLSRGRHHGHG
jgi:hypothetical protein